MKIDMKMWTKITTLLAIIVFFWAHQAWAATYQVSLEVSVPVKDTAGTGMTKAYNRLVLGVHPEATENYDPQWDTPAFFTTPDPENPALLRAYIKHPEYASNQQQLWRDIRSDASGSQKTWTVAVALAPSESSKTITLSWVLSPSLLASRENVTLRDHDSQASIDMRRNSSYSFVNDTSSPKILSVAISSPTGDYSTGDSHSGGSGGFGCGVVKRLDPGQPGPGLTVAIIVNLLILLTPILLRLRPHWL